MAVEQNQQKGLQGFKAKRLIPRLHEISFVAQGPNLQTAWDRVNQKQNAFHEVRQIPFENIKGVREHQFEFTRPQDDPGDTYWKALRHLTYECPYQLECQCHFD